MSIYTNTLTERVLLVDLKPYNVVAAAVQNKYVASDFYTTKPSDSPANITYTGCIEGDFFFSRAMFAGEKLGGISIPDYGLVTIINTQEPGAAASRFDDWIDPAKYTWAGREITVWILERGQPYSSKTELLDGIVSGIDYTENTITFRVKSKQYLLDKFIQNTRYAGTGGAEGGSELKGKPKPLCFGRAFNIEPVIIDATNLVYQFHDGAVQAIDAVREKGSNYATAGSDYANYAALVAAIITGDYITCRALGMIRLASKPNGRITADVRGSRLFGTYSAKFGDIAEYIVETYSTIPVNAAAITQINTDAPYELSFYTGIEDINIQDLFDSLTSDFFGWYGINRDNEFDCGIINVPAVSATLELTQFNIDEDTLDREPANEIVKTINSNYRKNWTVQTGDELASGLSEANRALYSKEGLSLAPTTDGTITTKYPQAIEKTVSSSIWDATDAQSVTDRRLAYYKVERSRYKMRTSIVPLQANLNDTVEITTQRYGLSSGKNCIIIAFEEYYIAARVNLTIEG